MCLAKIEQWLRNTGTLFKMLLSERFLEKGAVLGREGPVFQLKEHWQWCTPLWYVTVFVEIRVQGGSRAYEDYSSLHPCIHLWPQPRLLHNPVLDSDQRVQHELRKSHGGGEQWSPASSPHFVQFAHKFSSYVWTHSHTRQHSATADGFRGMSSQPWLHINFIQITFESFLKKEF